MSNDLYPLVSVPTRIIGQSATLIDNIFVRSANLKLCYADVVAFPCSDHLPLVSVMTCKLNRPKKKKIKTRLMKKGNLQKFVEEVSVIDWTPVFSEEESPTRALDNLMSVILPIYDSACPIKVMKVKKQEPRKPWITSEILEERKLRIELYQRYLDDKSDVSYELFKKQRNLVNKLRRKAMAEYYDRKFSNCKGNMKETWKLINEVTNGNAEIGRNEVQLEGFASDDKSGIANEFGNFFSNIGIKVQNSVKK